MLCNKQDFISYMYHMFSSEITCSYPRNVSNKYLPHCERTVLFLAPVFMGQISGRALVSVLGQKLKDCTLLHCGNSTVFWSKQTFFHVCQSITLPHQLYVRTLWLVCKRISANKKTLPFQPEVLGTYRRYQRTTKWSLITVTTKDTSVV